MSQQKDSEQMELLGPVPEKKRELWQTPTANLAQHSGQVKHKKGQQLRLTQQVNNPSLSPEDSPARTSVTQASKPELKVSVQDYGQNSPELLAKYDLPTQSWRTSQRCFLATEADGFSEYLETWPRSGMTVNGTAYRLPVLVPVTGGIESGSSHIPTPTTRDHFSARKTANRKKVWKSNDGTTLLDYVRMWPTPNAGLMKHSYHDKSQPYYEKRIKDGRQMDLAHKMYQEEGSGQLNPQFVEWLMGFPMDFTKVE